MDSWLRTWDLEGRQNDSPLLILTWFRLFSSDFPILSSPPPFYTALLGKKPSCAAHTYGVGGYALSPYGQSIYINYLEFLCMKNLSVLHPLFIQPLIYLHVDYLFYTVGYTSNTIFFCSFCSIFFGFGHWEFFFGWLLSTPDASSSFPVPAEW